MKQCLLPSVLWHCWLGSRKGIRPAKKLEWWGTGIVICLEWDADLHMVLPTATHCLLLQSLSLASVKSRLVLPFWYRLTRVVLEKGPLNECVLVVCETVLTYECITDSSTHFSTIQQVILTLCVHKCCRCLVPTLWHVWNCHLLSQTFWDQSKPVRNSKNNWTCYNWSNSLQRKGQLHHVLRK